VRISRIPGDAFILSVAVVVTVSVGAGVALAATTPTSTTNQLQPVAGVIGPQFGPPLPARATVSESGVLPPTAVTPKSSPADISALQTNLRWVGNWSIVNGKYDKLTSKNVSLFQWKQNMTRSGIADKVTVMRLSEVARGGTLDDRCKTKGIVICVDKSQLVTRYVKNGKVLRIIDSNIGPEAGDPKFGQYSVTREGTFHIFEKQETGFSSLYGYPMPFFMAFSGGEGFHYSAYFDQAGYVDTSMGCVTLDSFGDARWLFDHSPMDTKVVIYS